MISERFRKVLSKIVVFVVIFTMVPNVTVFAVDIAFVDSDLETCMKEQFDPDIPPERAITSEEALTITGTVNCSERTISSLGGLEYFTEITGLYLYSNGLTDISQLSYLTDLTFIGLDGNDIADLGPLSSLTNLTAIMAMDNQALSDLSPLSGMTWLTSLQLAYDPQISDITPLAGLVNLESLILDDTQVDDLAPLVGLTSLYHLGLNSANVSNISPLLGLTGLNFLNLSSNQISDISVLVSNAGIGAGDFLYLSGNLLNLTSVDEIETLSGRGMSTFNYSLCGNSIVDGIEACDDGDNDNGDGCSAVCQIEEAPAIVTFTDANLEYCIRGALGDFSEDPILVSDALTLTTLICTNDVIDLTGLEYFTNLSSLTLTNNSISDLTPLAGLDNLQGLEIHHNDIIDITPLAGLPLLSSLSISANQITDISPLAGLTNLHSLGFYENEVSDITPLSGLTALTYLNFPNNDVVNISVLADLTNLEYLGIGENQIVDIQPLIDNMENEGFGSGDEINLSGNPLSDESITLLEELTAHGVSVTYEESGGGEESWVAAWVTVEDGDTTVYILNANHLTGQIPPGDISIYFSIDGRDGHALTAALQTEDIEYEGTTYSDQVVVLTFEDPVLVGDVVIMQGYQLEDEEVIYYDEDAGTVTFTDANLEACVRADASVPDGGDITLEDALTVTNLDCEGSSIVDLSGLESFTNLEGLDLHENSIVDISPLSGLTSLHSLDLSHNSITDLSVIPWGDFTVLQGLYLSYNSISDISYLSAATSLEMLFAENNVIETVSDLSGLTSLWSLRLSNNIIGNNLSFINGLISLETLELGDNAITDISSLSGLTDSPVINTLSLGEVESVDVDDGLNDNNITDVTVLAGLTSLTNLNLCGGEVTDVSPLAGMVGMITLDLDGAPVQDFSPLYGMTNLTNFNAMSADITDVSFLSHFPNLTQFSFYGDEETPITGLDVFESLDSLTTLMLSGSGISDLSFLSGMVSLTSLNLSYNSIVELGSLVGLINLSNLELSNNSIIDIQPLVDNEGIGDGDIVDLSENSLSDESLVLVDVLAARGVEVVNEEDDDMFGDAVDFSVPTGDDHEFIIDVNWDGYNDGPIVIAFYYGSSIFSNDGNGGADGIIVVESPGTYHAYVPHVDGQTHVTIETASWADGDPQEGDEPDIFWFYENSPELSGDGPTQVDMNMDDPYYIGGVYFAILASGVSNSTVLVTLLMGDSEEEDDGQGDELFSLSNWTINDVSPVSMDEIEGFNFNLVFGNPVDSGSSLLLDMSDMFGVEIYSRAIIQAGEDEDEGGGVSILFNPLPSVQPQLRNLNPEVNPSDENEDENEVEVEIVEDDVELEENPDDNENAGNEGNVEESRRVEVSEPGTDVSNDEGDVADIGFEDSEDVLVSANSVQGVDRNIVENLLRTAVDVGRIHSDSTYESNVLNFVTSVVDDQQDIDRDNDGVPDYMEIVYGVENESSENVAEKVVFKIDPKDVTTPTIVNLDGKKVGNSPLILAVYKPNVNLNVFVKNLGDHMNTNNDGYFQIGTIAMDENGRGQLQISLDNGLSAGKYMAKTVGTDGVSGNEVSFEITGVDMDIYGLTVQEIQLKDHLEIDESVFYVVNGLERALGKDVFDSDVFISSKQEMLKYVVKGNIKAGDSGKKIVYLTYKSTIFSSVTLSDAADVGEYFQVEVPAYVSRNEMHNLSAYLYSPKNNASSSAKSFQFRMK